jgi:hypothetical protein
LLARLLALAPDTRERHALVADLVGRPERVLDVGGLPGRLSEHLPREVEVVTANVEPPADILMSGASLPLDDRSYGVVTSVDVLEHVPPADRAAFVAELVRVTHRRLVLCCPFGTAQHERSEQELLDWYASLTGERHRWLAEHVENGLPTDAELRDALSAWVDDASTHVDFLYHGDFRASAAQFKELTLAARKGARAQLTLAWKWLRHRRDLRISDEPTAWTNRVFVRLERVDPPRA